MRDIAEQKINDLQILHTKVPTFNSYTKCKVRQVTIHDRMPDCHGFPGMTALISSQINVALIRELRESLMSLAYYLTCYTRVCTTRHWQMSGRLVQDWNICIVRGSLMYLAFFLDIKSMGVCATRHWQMSGRLVQESNICIVRGSLMCLAFFLDMQSMGVCAIRHWQTSGGLVQELNVCTVHRKITLYLPLFGRWYTGLRTSRAYAQPLKWNKK